MGGKLFGTGERMSFDEYNDLSEKIINHPIWEGSGITGFSLVPSISEKKTFGDIDLIAMDYNNCVSSTDLARHLEKKGFPKHDMIDFRDTLSIRTGTITEKPVQADIFFVRNPIEFQWMVFSRGFNGLSSIVGSILKFMGFKLTERGISKPQEGSLFRNIPRALHDSSTRIDAGISVLHEAFGFDRNLYPFDDIINASQCRNTCPVKYSLTRAIEFVTSHGLFYHAWQRSEDGAFFMDALDKFAGRNIEYLRTFSFIPQMTSDEIDMIVMSNLADVVPGFANKLTKFRGDIATKTVLSESCVFNGKRFVDRNDLGAMDIPIVKSMNGYKAAQYLLRSRIQSLRSNELTVSVCDTMIDCACRDVKFLTGKL